jgi:uncharacterized 2Fe-2S/4Fe-4S cluster protein (DUF4445 family)
VAREYTNSPVAVPFARLAGVASRFRQAHFSGYAVVNEKGTGLEIVDFLAEKPDVFPAVALDLGTTHLEAVLLDLLTGKKIAEAHCENDQIQYGADILNRIHFADKNDGLAVLHKCIIGCINSLSEQLAQAVGIKSDAIRALSVSGNPTMVHFFLNISPHNLCREPYIPLVNAPDLFYAAELSLRLHPAAPVFIMPGVGSYFGGDLISGILATKLDLYEKTCMLIDVGTNAEVVLGSRDWLIACAGAAGPALEGGVARMGMRAGPGAIEHVRVDPETEEFICDTIGGTKPRGLCGSGIIDLVAALYLTGIIDIRGKFRPEKAGGRIVDCAEGKSFIVASANQAAENEPVLLSQVDLDALVRSKAAMYAILTTLVNQVGVSFGELHRIFVAGAFGRHIDPRQAITLGMLPDLPIEIFEPVGNSSLKGAEGVLLDRQVRERCKKVVNTITYIELNVNQEFMTRFSGSKFIPHTDRSLFPSVPVFDEGPS